MSYRRLNVVVGGGASVTIAPWEHPVVWEFLGKGRYLQAAFCRTAAQLYSAKFGCTTLKSLSNIVAEGALIGLVAWSKEIGCCWDESVFRSGVTGGSVAMLKFLKDNNCTVRCDAYLCYLAGAGGHLEALKFLREVCGCVWGASCCEGAAVHGRLNILQNAHSQQPFSSDWDSCCWHSHKVCRLAAERGHIHVLEWAHETLHEDGLFDTETCKAAARGGKVDVLKYLRRLGCAWDGSTCLEAIMYGQVCVLEWALDNGCSWAVHDTVYQGATGLHYANNVDVIEFLISRGANINATDDFRKTPIYCAVAFGTLEAVESLVRLGADVNIADIRGETPLDRAITLGRHAIVDVLRAAGARE